MSSPYAEREHRKPGRPARYDAATRSARHREQSRRNNRAKYRALEVLADRHQEEYRELLDVERKAIDVEWGPLPGDEGGGS